MKRLNKQTIKRLQIKVVTIAIAINVKTFYGIEKSMNPVGAVPTSTKLRSHKLIGSASTRPRFPPLVSGIRAKFSAPVLLRAMNPPSHKATPATLTTKIYQGYTIQRINSR